MNIHLFLLTFNFKKKRRNQPPLSDKKAMNEWILVFQRREIGRVDKKDDNKGIKMFVISIYECL